MQKETLTYKDTNSFSKTVEDYLSQQKSIGGFYANFGDLNGFRKQITLKKTSKETRDVLVKTLTKQYENLETSVKTKENIARLKNENTFTITTGHQLNLFTGPLYFLYKIISTINLCEQLQNEFPQHNFVPMYWMATEDHDFEEIQYFNFKDKKINWNRKSKGAVGRLSTEGLESVFEEIPKLFSYSDNAKKLTSLFKESYLEHHNLTDATRFLTNTLFKNYGLVILDADHNSLKTLFKPFIKDELLNQTSYKEVTKTNTLLKEHYKIQVNPREINLFYLTDVLRERIVFSNGKFQVKNTDIEFTQKTILEEIEKHPERFSPNVIMRPLYQEVILPNLSYIGGGGELAYWLQLKAYFKRVNVVFPILLLRNSALIINSKQARKLNKLGISNTELFLKQTDLITKKIKEMSNLNLDFSEQKQFLNDQFKRLKEIASQTDTSFIGAVNAQEKKQLNGLDNLEKRLLKAEKRKLQDITNRIIEVQNSLFPKQSLQERSLNFSELYLDYGDALIPYLKTHLKPLDLEFSVLNL